ncbi:MAG: hypothetical protein ACRC5M_06990 [Anaeroplasmataceae bacterium]
MKFDSDFVLSIFKKCRYEEIITESNDEIHERTYYEFVFKYDNLHYKTTILEFWSDKNIEIIEHPIIVEKIKKIIHIWELAK